MHEGYAIHFKQHQCICSKLVTCRAYQQLGGPASTDAAEDSKLCFERMTAHTVAVLP